MYAPQLTFPGADFVALGESQRLTPRAGALIVFPSWLSHGVCPYRGNRERISIAINFSIAALDSGWAQHSTKLKSRHGLQGRQGRLWVAATPS